jgi:hypothetical protein
MTAPTPTHAGALDALRATPTSSTRGMSCGSQAGHVCYAGGEVDPLRRRDAGRPLQRPRPRKPPPPVPRA